MEKNSLAAYQAARADARSRKLTDDQLADRIEKDVLPGWAKESRELTALKGLPPESRSTISSLAKYIDARQQGWSLMVHGLRAHDVNVVKAGVAKENEAEWLARALTSEEVQAVGMSCRECLIAFVRSVSDPKMVPQGQDAPKAGDVIHWAELIADTVAHGSRAADIRGYLKTLAKATWQLASWLTHAADAVRYDGTMAVDATYAVLNAYGAAILRHERPTADRCPRCNSLRIQVIDEPEFESGLGIACESCGAVTDSAEPTRN